jgi:LmbE family N-acetylglucosaminyl deacetylase
MPETARSTLPSLALTTADRVLILAPHPDDETIATGGIIQQAVAMGLPVHVIFLTYGDNAETAFIAYRKRIVRRGKAAQAMGLVRHDEAVAAAGILGLRPDQLTFLGYPDFRTLKIWAEHWRDAPHCESMFTSTTVVPYPNAFRPGAPYKADEVLADLKTIIRGFRPTVIFTSHPGDHNPDHLSLYLFMRVALWDLEAELRPAVWPFLVHHPEWPQPEGYHPELALTPPARLASEPTWHAAPVSPQQIETKHRAVQAHRTQMAFGREYLDSFMRSNELFGDILELDLRGRSGERITGREQPAIAPQLTHSERLKFVGIEERAIWMDGDRLAASVKFSKPVGQSVVATVYLFGYRPDTPFSHMPKLQLVISQLKSAFYDQGRELVGPELKLEVSAHQLAFSLPLAELGHPKWLLLSARTQLASVPLDWIAWRAIAMPGW